MGAGRFAAVIVVASCVFVCVFSRGTALAAPSAPAVSGVSFSNVGSASATVSGEVNANGSVTSYWFEYSTQEACFESESCSRTPVESIGDPTSTVSLLASIAGLQSETVYFFRLVASNEGGVNASTLVQFTTFPVAPLGLPDGRGFEMVTPVDNEDMNVYAPEVGGYLTANELAGSGFDPDFLTTRTMQAAPNGGVITYRGSPTAGGNSNFEFGNAYLAVRSPLGGWRQTNLQPGGKESAEFWGFSNDLSLGIVDSYESLSATLSPSLAEYYHVLYSDNLVEGRIQPFFNVTPHKSYREFGGTGGAASHLTYVGGSADMRHLLFEANDALTAKAEEDPPPSGTGANSLVMDLYDSVGGDLFLVNVLPDGKADPKASFGSYPNVTHVISSDGSRIFWTDLNTGDVYVRLNDTMPQSPLGGAGECMVPTDACTLAVSAGTATYWTASAGGRYAFYTEGDALYRFDVETGERLALESDTAAGTGNVSTGSSEITSFAATAGAFKVGDPISGQGIPRDTVVTDVSSDALTISNPASATGTGVELTSPANVQGVVGASEDGEYVYFAAGGVMAGANSEGKSPQAWQANLYLSHAGVTTFVGIGEPVDWRPVGRTAGVTADGNGVVFMASQSLTGYNSEGMAEVYVYDASNGSVTCGSCDSSGEPPVFTQGSHAAAYLPVDIPHENNPMIIYQPRWISEDGSLVIFNSNEPLVPQDTNAKQDVYEWERDGTGSCGRVAGCIYLLSGGTSNDNSYLLDASANGDDVFIITRAELVPQDKNEYFDLYDARVGVPQPLAEQACSGTGCQGVPGSPPVFATPSSVTFNGVGNFLAGSSSSNAKPRAKPLTRGQRLAGALRACARQRRRRRAACRRRAHARYGATAAAGSRHGNGRGM